MEEWLAGDAERLLELRPKIDATLQSLEARALPYSEADRRADLESHPDFARWSVLKDEVPALQRAMRVRKGQEEFQPLPLPKEIEGAGLEELFLYGWYRVVFDPKLRRGLRRGAPSSDRAHGCESSFRPRTRRDSEERLAQHAARDLARPVWLWPRSRRDSNE
jgi:hypothetical protein